MTRFRVVALVEVNAKSKTAAEDRVFTHLLRMALSHGETVEVQIVYQLPDERRKV